MPIKKKQPRRRKERVIFSGARGKKAIDAILQSGDLSGFVKKAFEDLNLRGAQLANQDFTKTYWGSVDLRNANLSGAIFRDAVLRETNLSDSNLSKADFTGARLIGTSINDANLDGTILATRNLQSGWDGAEVKAPVKKIRGTPAALPKGAALVSGYIIARGSSLRSANLSNLDLRGMTFRGVDLVRADFRGSNLDGARFDECLFSNTNFGGVDLSSVKILRCVGSIKGTPAKLPRGFRLLTSVNNDLHLIGPRCQIRGADFENADLSNLDLRFAMLAGVHFTNPLIESTDLPVDLLGMGMTRAVGTPRSMMRGYKIIAGTLLGRGCGVNGADLRGLDLGRLDLRRSKGYALEIEGTDFSGCDLNGSQWTVLRGVPKAMPKGFVLVKQPGAKSAFDGIFVREGSPEATREQYAFPDPTSNVNFEHWFKGSKVSDSGRPLVAYHGSKSQPFTSFDPSKIDPHHPGFYFTNDIRVANTYLGKKGDIPDPLVLLASRTAGAKPRTSRAAQGIYRVYLGLKHPYIYEGKGEEWSALKDPQFPNASKTFQLAHAVKNTGKYDGVIFRNIIDPGGNSDWEHTSDVYVAFEPTQVKSALVNDGSYSSTDPDIRRNPARTSRRSLRKPRTSRVKLPPGSKFGVPPPVIGGMPYAGKWTLVGSRRLGIPKETSDIDYMVRLEDVWHNISEFRPYAGVEGAYWKNFPRSKPKSGVVAIPGWAYDVLDKSMEQAVRRFSPAKMRKMRKELGKYKFYKTIGVAYTKPTLAPYAVPKRSSSSPARKTSHRTRRTSRS